MKAQKMNNRSLLLAAINAAFLAETEAFIDDLRKKHENLTTTAMGSSLKLCLVAEGAADLYPRFAPTMEWYTAAGQAIVQASGRTVKDVIINKKELLNNWFIVE